MELLYPKNLLHRHHEFPVVLLHLVLVEGFQRVNTAAGDAGVQVLRCGKMTPDRDVLLRAGSFNFYRDGLALPSAVNRFMVLLQARNLTYFCDNIIIIYYIVSQTIVRAEKKA